MKITLSKSELLEKLNPAMGTVSVRNTIRAIEGVLIETMPNGELELSTYDMNKGIKTRLKPLSVEEGGKIILNATRFMNILRVLNDDIVTVTVKEDMNAVITSGRSRFTMSALHGEDFPSLPEMTEEKGIRISSPLLRSMIAKVMSSVADSDRTNINGAFVTIADEKIRAVACNGYTLAICEAPCATRSVGFTRLDSLTIRIPAHALGEMMKILPDGEEDEVSLFVARKHIVVRPDTLLFFTRTIDGEYVDYERLKPKEKNIFVTVNREMFLAGLEKVNLIADEKIQGQGRGFVRITIEDGKIHLLSTSANGEVKDEIDCEKQGDDIMMGFNCRLLINAVRAMETEKIRLTMEHKSGPMTLEPVDPEEGKEEYYLVLPIRMKEE